MNLINRLSIVSLLAAACFLSAHAQDKLSIGAVMYARDSQAWQQMERGMKDTSAKYGVDLQVTLSRRQLPTEAQVMEDLVNRR